MGLLGNFLILKKSIIKFSNDPRWWRWTEFKNDIRGEKELFKVTQIRCKFKENLMILEGLF